jgi:hypothetical protein
VPRFDKDMTDIADDGNLFEELAKEVCHHVLECIYALNFLL